MSLWLNKVDLVVTETALTHLGLIVGLAGELLVKFDLRDMLGRRDRVWEVVQVLEPVLVCFVHWEGGPFRLQVEVDETCRAWLQDCLVERVHHTQRAKFDFVVMKGIFARAFVTFSAK